MKTYLVTGVAGFIPSAIARRLIKDGHTVIGIDNFATGYKSNIPPEVKFFEIDVSEAAQLEQLNDFKIDAVFHLAAQSSGEISFYDPPKDLRSNALGTLNMLEYARKQKIGRFLYASSMAVYGDTPDTPILITENAHPKSYYGISKLAGEYYVDAFSDRMNTTSFRMFNVYGPGQDMENIRQGMASIYLYYFMKGEPITVKGSKDRSRDFIYIDDVAAAWAGAVEEPKTFGKKYNLGSGRKTTVEELLRLMAKIWGEPNHPITYAEGTPKDIFCSYADINELLRDLKWKPEVNLEKGLELFITWVKQKQAASSKTL
ncbi:MAG: NAD-dependent epimerase/dehydratase family protein [Patescibacteria group bacterium]